MPLLSGRQKFDFSVDIISRASRLSSIWETVPAAFYAAFLLYVFVQGSYTSSMPARPSILSCTSEGRSAPWLHVLPFCYVHGKVGQQATKSAIRTRQVTYLMFGIFAYSPSSYA